MTKPEWNGASNVAPKRRVKPQGEQWACRCDVTPTQARINPRYLKRCPDCKTEQP